MNKKTLHRFFYVFGVLIVFSCLLLSVTPLSFAVDINNRTPYDLPIDTSFQYLYKYFYGANSGIIDYKDNGTNHWYRIIINNNFTTCTLIKTGSGSSVSYTLQIDLSKPIYRYDIGTVYSSSTRFTSQHWEEISSGTLYCALNNLPYVNSCGVPIKYNNISSSDTIHCDFNSYYPLSASSGDRAATTIIDNANSIASSQDQAASSRQAEIMSEGSDITVSTVDDWVNGQNGLAGKLTELAATLSSNADIFSQNQVSNQENLSRAGDFVTGVFNQVPTGIVAACLCFLIILIAVKVVGR